MPTIISGTTGVSKVQDSVVTDETLNLTANSASIKTALNASGSAPIYACRAWVNFSGIDTVAIRASGNVSSITDNGVGDYTVNFMTAMPNVNYISNLNARRSTTSTNYSYTLGESEQATKLVSSVRLTSQYHSVGSGSQNFDNGELSCSFFR